MGRGGLSAQIASSYARTMARSDIEAPERCAPEDRLPETGMLVHAEYTLYGFFVALRRMFGNAGKVRFFLDQDSGMRAACLSAFRDFIQAGRCDAFFVRIVKDMTIDEKRRKMDAIVFDPDPLRGGKIVIQAKRYTNTVDVSAVRDLYGAVINEGAVKGILVTTSHFGPDAYSFAKDKPLTLLNGNELLGLLEKHGYKFRINLAEAKALL